MAITSQLQHLTLKQSNTQVNFSCDFSSSSTIGSTPSLSMQILQADQVFKQLMQSSLLTSSTRSVCFLSTFSKISSKGYFSLSVQCLCSSYISKVKQGNILSQNSQKFQFSLGLQLWTSLRTYPKAMNIPPSFNMFRSFIKVYFPGKKCSACPTVMRSNFSSSFRLKTWLFYNKMEECLG